MCAAPSCACGFILGSSDPLLYKIAQTQARPLLAWPFDLALRHLKYGKTS